jgi:DNA primase
MSGMIPQDIIDQVRDASDIVQVIGEYIRLKKRGRNYLALCPFHTEKTPSFSVSQDKQIFHCFGCGKGGNVFTFLILVSSSQMIFSLN